MTITPRRPASLTPAVEGALCGLLAASIWGAYIALTRAGTTGGLTAVDFVMLRFGVGAVVMIPFLTRRDLRNPGQVGWGRALVLTLLAGPLFMLLGAGGYAFAPLAHGAVIQPGTMTLTSLLLAALVLGDRPSRMRLWGIGLILVGLVLISASGLGGGSSTAWIGDLMFAASAVLWAVFTILLKRWKADPIAITAAVSVISAVFVVPLYLAFSGFDRMLALPIPMLVVQVVVQGVLSGVVAVIAYARAVVLIGPAKAAVFPALVPAFATVIGVPVTGEWPTFLQSAGLVTVSLGLLAAIEAIRFRRRASRG